MKPPPFELLRPESVDEARDVLARYGDEAKVLAGGQSLLPLLNMRLAAPAVLVDLNLVRDLCYIDCGTSLVIGAMTRQRAVERSPDVAAACGILPVALRHVAHVAIRTRGTVGGSVVHGDPAGELPGVICALDADVVATSVRGERVIPASELYSGFLTTTLAPDELVVAIRFPSCAGLGWSFEEVSRRSGDFAVVAVSVLLAPGDSGGGPGDTLSRASIALSGVGATVVRARRAEQVLIGSEACEDAFAEAARVAALEIDPRGDLHGSAAYRRHLARRLTEDGLRSAWRHVAGGSP